MNKPLVGIVMGSQSDWEVMQHAAEMLKSLGVPFETKVVSAHRTPDLLFEYAASAPLPPLPLAKRVLRIARCLLPR